MLLSVQGLFFCSFKHLEKNKTEKAVFWLTCSILSYLQLTKKANEATDQWMGVWQTGEDPNTDMSAGRLGTKGEL